VNLGTKGQHATSRPPRPLFSESEMYICLRVMYPLFLSDFNKTWILSTDFRKGLKYQISWKSVLWKPNSSMRPNRRTLWNKYSLFEILPTRLKTSSGWYNTVQASVREGLPGVFHVPQRTILRILHENGTHSVTPNHSTFSISNLVTTPQAGNF